MQQVVRVVAFRAARVLSLVCCSILATLLLVRFAPGYFSDNREMDAAHSSVLQADLARMRVTQTSLYGLLREEAASLSRGDLGTSRHYGVPVSSLLRERAATSVVLLLKALALGWGLATCLSFLISARRTNRGEFAISAVTIALIAVPIGLLATVCMVSNLAGPVVVLSCLIGARDFRLLYRLLRAHWQAPYLLYARAQGFSPLQAIRAHVLPSLRRELTATAIMSFTLALSALVPIEVIFDVPGLGQLAWDAAMNRDLPVLLAVTSLLAALVGLGSLFMTGATAQEPQLCV